MIEPVRTSDTTYSVDVEFGETFFWCAYGRSKSQLLCDGSQKNG